MTTNCITLLYARISTNNTEQLKSLNNQIQQLKDYKISSSIKKAHIVSEIRSIAKCMSSYLRQQISKYNVNNNICIVVTAMDRLVRNIIDITFLKRNVKYIIVLNENKQYNVHNDWKDILHSMALSMDEIETIKRRFTQSDVTKRTRNSSEELSSLAKHRCLSINNILLKNNTGHGHAQLINDTTDIIQSSQNLNSLYDWTRISNLSTKHYGMSFINEYEHLTDNIKSGETYFIPKNLITHNVNLMFKDIVNIDKNILKEYINSNLHYGKKYYSINDDDNDDNDDHDDNNDKNARQFCNILNKFSSNKKIKKLLTQQEQSDIENVINKLNKLKH